ncbi:LOW QUALITY PROTEIN: 60S ribosomal export protein NMD3-like [Hydractinia symbiolongicarpus]|uniref:LOW QUALITY PROTEIN: 60S ribosomal export protein NMD3-like n=1 Tax=Hydractinia symbiolongicarpus TaxID=13093 RepID=UPI00254B5E91|nr:LOW QUALITY PROTEIN: 60S ribosomal export protein NMD3-like [Hydractinia symbiolongicarpus]
MEYVQHVNAVRQQQILCCQCGTPTPPNPSNICIACIRTQVDITEGIQKQAYLQFCKSCERYLQPPNYWVSCELESKELLALCLKRLKGLAKTHLVDAGFVWTEPHSKRIKVKLTIQQEVLNSTKLQQTFVVDFIVQGQMCDDCHRREAKDFWKAVVQIRQKASHKKTFYYLEQLIIKHNIHSNCLNINQVHEGLDFYYSNKQHSRRMVDFLNTVVPCRMKTSERLISHDIHNNSYNYKNTFSVELASVCKNDIVCLPIKVARSLGNISQISVCYKVTSNLHLVDPFTGKILPSRCYLMRNNDMSGSDAQFHCRTHLGHLLSAGDTVIGYDFTTTNLNDPNLELIKKDNIPDVVLVKKVYGDKKKRSRKRNWKLKSLPMEKAHKDDYDEFLEDLEEDREYRSVINIYRDRAKVNASESDIEDAPTVGLEEMLDDLQIEDQEMNSDED